MNSTSVPKFNAILFPYVIISFVTLSAVYVFVCLLSTFIIFTCEFAVNSPDDCSSTDTALFVNSTDWNITFLSLLSIKFVSWSSSIIVILSVYMHINLFLSWYCIFVINLSFSPSYVFSTEFVGSVLAFSIDIILILDFIIVPDVSTSAIAKYLLSFDIVISVALVDDRYVLNNSFPSGEYTATTVL